MTTATPTVELLEFARRHFDDSEGAFTKVEMSEEKFMGEVHEAIAYAALAGGYASGIKHLWMTSFSSTKLSYIDRFGIKEENIKHEYIRRGDENPKEIPFLSEWVEGVEAPNAPWFDIILYSRENLAKEGIEIESDFGIVSINAELSYGVSCPMDPNTHLRNALGVEFGGNGVPLNRKEYEEACVFWAKHIKIGR